MNSEYRALKAALLATEIPFAEYAWDARPEADIYGVISSDFEAPSFDADGIKADRVLEGSVDLFFTDIANREELVSTVEEKLTEILGNSWELNSTQYENETGLFHIEWAFQCMDGPETNGEAEEETSEETDGTEDSGETDDAEDEPEGGG